MSDASRKWLSIHAFATVMGHLILSLTAIVFVIWLALHFAHGLPTWMISIRTEAESAAIGGAIGWFGLVILGTIANSKYQNARIEARSE